MSSVLRVNIVHQVPLGNRTTYLIKRQDGVKLDDAMEPAKEDGDRPQEDINGVADKVCDQLDEFRKGHPPCEDAEGEAGVFRRPVASALDQKPP